MAVIQGLIAPSRATDTQSTVQRLWEIDALRGVAVVMMVIYHLVWDLYFLQIVPTINLYSGFWKYFQRTTASTFLFLVGVSLVISYNRTRGSKEQTGQFRKFLRRSLIIFGLGMVITLVVWFAGTGSVDFGVLHLIGFSIVAAYPFLRFTWINIALWMLLNFVGSFLQAPLVVTKLFVWLGLKPPFYAAVDYFPIIPWFGVVLLGIGMANILYPRSQRRFNLPDLSRGFPTRALQYLGRHSLVIYLLHQPILIGGLFVYIYLFSL
ncbi:DUF1624 domain-containing protein [Chloroflexi bacterium TSY]|nr:DUF1624 domain-containing protein [Chloroflexi bacterium TSY]